MRGAAPGGDPRGPAAADVLHAAVAAFVASGLVGVWAAPDRAAAAASLRMFAFGGVLHAVIWLAGRRAPWHRVMPLGAMLGGALAATYFLTQYRHLVTDAKVSLTHALGQALSGPAPALGWWTPQTNTVGTLLDGLVCLAAGAALGRGSVAVRALAGAAAAVMALGIVVSASRGSWLAVLVAVAAAAVVALPGRKIPPAVVGGVVTAGVLAVVASAVAPGVPWWMRLAAHLGRPDRLEVYQHALTLVRDAPFTGIGAGDEFARALSSYALLIQVPYLTYAHNLAVDLWLEHGLPGLAAWWALAAALAAAAVAGERARLGWRFRGAWAGLLAIHVHGLSDARASVDAWLWLPFFVLTGILAAQVSRHGVRLPRAWALAPPVVAVAVCGASIAGRGAVGAAWHANLGALAQGRADGFDRRSDPRAASAEREARAHFARALRHDAGDGPALRRLGLLDLASGHYDEAARHLGGAWREDPGHVTTRKAYGLAAVWTGDLDLAVELLRALPGMADELNTWSTWRASRGELARAIAAAQVSLRLEPAQPAIVDLVHRLERDARRPPVAGPRD
ncbi:MAG: O-antigen ligase family protein [Acidobacteria bacterium]|nr:O-antigen ligase family protein [Acidobacteriota bacterium]